MAVSHHDATHINGRIEHHIPGRNSDVRRCTKRVTRRARAAPPAHWVALTMAGGVIVQAGENLAADGRMSSSLVLVDIVTTSGPSTSRVSTQQHLAGHVDTEPAVY